VVQLVHLVLLVETEETELLVPEADQEIPASLLQRPFHQTSSRLNAHAKRTKAHKDLPETRATTAILETQVHLATKATMVTKVHLVQAVHLVVTDSQDQEVNLVLLAPNQRRRDLRVNLDLPEGPETLDDPANKALQVKMEALALRDHLVQEEMLADQETTDLKADLVDLALMDPRAHATTALQQGWLLAIKLVLNYFLQSHRFLLKNKPEHVLSMSFIAFRRRKNQHVFV
jgi:hypothetical protein